MVPIEAYILEDQEKRQTHLDLVEPCSEIGGSSSIEFKALLAYHIGTTIPSRGQGYKIQLCHACGNAKCSNVRHLYWGTPSENIQDSKNHGTWTSLPARMVAKYGEAGLRDARSRGGKASGPSRTKPQEFWEQYRPSFEAVDMTKRGWKQALARQLGMSHSHVGRIQCKLGL